jgi:SsrA-binding protein
MRTKLSVVNKKARFEYEFIETFTAGIQLIGSEVKTVKRNKFYLSIFAEKLQAS